MAKTTWPNLDYFTWLWYTNFRADSFSFASSPNGGDNKQTKDESNVEKHSFNLKYSRVVSSRRLEYMG